MWAKMRRTLLLCLLGGAVYVGIEVLWRGHSHWSMFLLAALLSLPLDQINEHVSWDMPLPRQALLGALGITLAELLAGLLFNRALGLAVWDYSTLPLNFMGQICLAYSLLWIPLAAFGIVLFDVLRWQLFGEVMPRYCWRRERM